MINIFNFCIETQMIWAKSLRLDRQTKIIERSQTVTWRSLYATLGCIHRDLTTLP